MYPSASSEKTEGSVLEEPSRQSSQAPSSEPREELCTWPAWFLPPLTIVSWGVFMIVLIGLVLSMMIRVAESIPYAP